MIETRPATIEDAEPISALLMANSPDRGGALHGDWPIGVVTESCAFLRGSPPWTARVEGFGSGELVFATAGNLSTHHDG